MEAGLDSSTIRASSVKKSVTQERTTTKTKPGTVPTSQKRVNTYYELLGLHPSASVIEIRRAYRQLSKLYHPDTTELATSVATAKFQQLNEAYATLSSPERRMLYDAKIGYSRVNVIQVPRELEKGSHSKYSNSAYLDPTDRPLSSGEIFALFILGITFVICLLVAIAIGLTQGEAAFQIPNLRNETPPTQELLTLYHPKINFIDETF